MSNPPPHQPPPNQPPPHQPPPHQRRRGIHLVPFAKNEDIINAPIILEDISRGQKTATLQFFDYRTENYSTKSGLFLDRESLLEPQNCGIFIRPNLFLNECWLKYI